MLCRPFTIGFRIVPLAALCVALACTTGSAARAGDERPDEKPASDAAAKKQTDEAHDSASAPPASGPADAADSSQPPPAPAPVDGPATEQAASLSPYEAAARAARERARADVKVFTNEDLGTAPPSESPPSAPTDEAEAPAPASADPLMWLEKQQAEEQDRAARVAEAEAAVNQARERVANLQSQVLAIKNPFAARPQLSEKERERREADRSTVDRLNRVQEELEQARAELAEAEAALDRARAGTSPRR